MSNFKIVKLVDPIQLNLAGGLNFQGDYDNATAYVVGDVVTYNGSSYAALQNTTGNLPTDVTYWQVLANKGDTGATGATGAGVASGGTTNQALTKIDGTDYNTQWSTVDKSFVGLGNVDNTSDANKPVSTATQTALDGKVDENVAITGATKTKITYDAKGLVTAGADATTADIADSLNKRYVTDANLTVIGNTSGTNTGDNATNSQYSGLDAAKVNKAGDTMTGNLNMGTNKLIGGTRITDVLKLQGTTDNGTLTSPAIQLLTGNNGATTALTVLNNGNVGIGTTSPGAKLQVDTGAAATIGQIIKGASAQTADYLQIRTSGATAGDILAVKSNGRVGIGVSDPQATLEIAGDIETTIGANRKLKLSSATAYWYDLQSTNDNFQIIEASDVNKVRLTIKYPNGNVGIGNTAPGAKLQVDTGAAATIGQIIKGATSQTADLLQIQDSSANKLMVVSSGGNVGIGVAAPATPLEVNGIVRADRTAVPAQYIQLDGGDGNNTALRAVAANKFLYIDNSDTSGANLYNAIVFRNGTAGDTERMRVDANGNVGIGTTSPSEKLVISGTVKATGYKSSDGSAGVSGSFTTTDGKTITIKDGLVVSIV